MQLYYQQSKECRLAFQDLQPLVMEKLESWDYEPRNATDDIVAKILDAYHEHQIK